MDSTTYIDITEESNHSTSTEKSSMEENLENLSATNQLLLDYFVKEHIKKNELLQRLQSELLELTVKLQELERTKELYAFQGDTKKQVFSPLNNAVNTTKGAIINEQLATLQPVADNLKERIHQIEEELNSINGHIAALQHSTDSLQQLKTSIQESFVKESEELASDLENTSTDAVASEQENITTHGVTSDQENTTTDGIASKREYTSGKHICNWLTYQQYDHNNLSKRIQSSLYEGLNSQHSKLELIQWSILSDPNRARVTVQELMDINTQLTARTARFIQSLNTNMETFPPLWVALDECVQRQKAAHPDYIIESSIDCTDYNIKIKPILTKYIITYIEELFRNSYRHANANRILLYVYIKEGTLDVYLHDNGTGIDPTYLANSSWHSGLHRLHEFITLLDGKLQIEGNSINGTSIRFTFPLIMD